jgi:inner membrane protein
MDSISQAVLGAVTFALVKDKEIGKKALLYGAVLGTIPDLDVLLNPFFSSVQQLAIHRAFSHSIFFSILLSGILAFWFAKKHKTEYKGWFLACFIALFTHPLLDTCTTYGTRLLYPLTKEYYSLNNVFVVDPAYTFVLLFATIMLWIKPNDWQNRKKIINWSLILSTSYLVWGLCVRTYIYNKYENILTEKNISFEKMTVVPTPLNTFFWQIVVKSKTGYYFTDYSIFDRNPKTNFHYENNEIELIKDHQNKPELEPLFNFLEGYEFIRKEGDFIHVYAAKFGPLQIKNNQAQFVFPFVIDKNGKGIVNEEQPQNGDEILAKLWERIKGN